MADTTAIPTRNEVRHVYARAAKENGMTRGLVEGLLQFDRMIDAAMAEAWDEGRRSAYADGVDRRSPLWNRPPNPYGED